MPINSGMHKSVSSEWETSAEAAKANAAFNTILELYERNELNEHLDPITKEIFYKNIHRADKDDILEWSQFGHKNNSSASFSVADLYCYSSYMAHRPGGNKRKQIYRKKVTFLIKVSIKFPKFRWILRNVKK